MSLDETCLSNGEVYTILTNKAAHGGKGALAAMGRGVASDTVSAILKKSPATYAVESKLTTDLGSLFILGDLIFHNTKVSFFWLSCYFWGFTFCYAYNLATLNKKNFMSVTPLKSALNAFNLAFHVSYSSEVSSERL